MQSRRFVFLDVMIVLVLIILFSFYLIPYLLRRPTSYDIEAIGNLRTVVGSQKAYICAEGGYASTWKELRDEPIASGKPAYLDIDLSVVVQGYTYTLQPAGKSLIGTNGTTVYTDFTCTAVPVEYKKGSKRSFYVDSSCVIRFEYGKTATIESEPI